MYGGTPPMMTQLPKLACPGCGSNRLFFPKSGDGAVKCEDCGQPVASLHELQDKIANGGTIKESRTKRLKRHAKEVADSHEQLRASVAQTDRLIVASDEMIRRHRQEDDGDPN